MVDLSRLDTFATDELIEEIHKRGSIALMMVKVPRGQKEDILMFRSKGHNIMVLLFLHGFLQDMLHKAYDEEQSPERVQLLGIIYIMGYLLDREIERMTSD